MLCCVVVVWCHLPHLSNALYSTDQWTTAVIDAIAPVSAVLNKPPLGPTVSVLRTPNGDFYALNAGGFNPKGMGTIQKVTWDTPATNRC